MKPLTVTSLPVGAMPAISPSCVPRAFQRVATVSPSATCSFTVMRASEKAAMYFSKFAFTPAGPLIGSGSAGS